mmetsp:Transcript_11581/g.21660  ORF Transcript_11581/g.21660 Transcript_11581/m.21660 type:complete len:269 (-) Transcript_11581:817-1623(-)
MEGTNSGHLRNLQKVGGVGRVPSSYHKDEVQSKLLCVLHQFVDGVLPFLCGIANGIKFHVMLIKFRRSILFHHGLLQQLTNGTCLLLIHGGLICQSHVTKHRIRIKSFRHGILEIFHKCGFIPSIQNIIRNHLGLLHIFDTNIVLTKRRCSNRLLMTILSMNDRSQTLPLMHIYRIPYLGYPRTGSIHNLYILLIEQFHLFKARPKCWQNDHILISHHRKILSIFILFNKIHIHGLKIIIHFRIMNQLIGNMYLPIRKVLHGLIRQRN